MNPKYIVLKRKIFLNSFTTFLSGFLTCGFFFIITFNNINEYSFTGSLNTQKYQHKLAIIVPFRDRFDELLMFVPQISKYLQLKSIDFKIYIINQIDNFRFNRASLINIGFLFSMNESDYMAMHDVDLLPLNSKVDYSYPYNGLYHLSAPGLHPEYDYKTFIGGILIVNKQDFIKTNGMSNNYFGWGKEDDEYYLRLRENNLTVFRLDINKFKTGNKFTFQHNHLAEKRLRDKKRFFKQKKEALKLDQTGLNNIKYRIDQIRQNKIDNYEYTIVDAELFCDKMQTHWCSMNYQFIND